MLKFTPEMREAIKTALDERAFCIVGTADSEGWANISYRGSVAVYDDDTLSFWNRNRTETVKNIEQNPKATIFYRNRQREANWRFFGEARIVTNPEERQRIIDVTDDRELSADPELKGIGILVKVERVIDQSGRVILKA